MNAPVNGAGDWNDILDNCLKLFVERAKQLNFTCTQFLSIRYDTIRSNAKGERWNVAFRTGVFCSFTFFFLLFSGERRQVQATCDGRGGRRQKMRFIALWISYFTLTLSLTAFRRIFRVSSFKGFRICISCLLKRAELKEERNLSGPWEYAIFPKSLQHNEWPPRVTFPYITPRDSFISHAHIHNLKTSLSKLQNVERSAHWRVEIFYLCC